MSKKEKILLGLNAIIGISLIITLVFGIKNYKQISEVSKPAASKINDSIEEVTNSNDEKEKEDKLKEQEKQKEAEKLKEEEKQKEIEKLKEEKKNSSTSSTDNASVNTAVKNSKKNVQEPKQPIKTEYVKIQPKTEEPKIEEQKKKNLKLR